MPSCDQKTSENPLPKMGDVIVSPKFAFGYYEDDERKGPITVDGVTKMCPRVSFLPEEEWVALAARTGKIPPRTTTTELGAYDPSRGTAKFVVEEAHMAGGCRGLDPYPDGWHVRARRLTEWGSYNTHGEVIQFYMTGCFVGMVEPRYVRIVDKMQMQFVSLGAKKGKAKK